jgi:hypothetical protein
MIKNSTEYNGNNDGRNNDSQDSRMLKNNNRKNNYSTLTVETFPIWYDVLFTFLLIELKEVYKMGFLRKGKLKNIDLGEGNKRNDKKTKKNKKRGGKKDWLAMDSDDELDDETEEVEENESEEGIVHQKAITDDFNSILTYDNSLSLLNSMSVCVEIYFSLSECCKNFFYLIPFFLKHSKILFQSLISLLPLLNFHFSNNNDEYFSLIEDNNVENSYDQSNLSKPAKKALNIIFVVQLVWLFYFFFFLCIYIFFEDY